MRSHLKDSFNINKTLIAIQVSKFQVILSSNLNQYYSSSAIETAGDILFSLKEIYKYDLNRIKIDQPYINAIRNKFELLALVVIGNLHILLAAKGTLTDLFLMHNLR